MSGLWRLRVFAKRWLARVTLVIEFCKRCGVRQPVVWLASDDLWEKVSGRYGVLCVECFDRLADEQGMLLRWTPLVEFVTGPADEVDG